MAKSKHKDHIIDLAVQMLTCDNPIDIMLLSELDERLQGLNANAMAQVLAGDYKWQDLISE